LIIAEQGAALFDCRLAEWLPVLETTERLQANASSGGE
jgi:hypothetical protein